MEMTMSKSKPIRLRAAIFYGGRLLKSLSKIDLLLIDELGYINAKTEQTNIFFKLMEERHHRRPAIITTNWAYPEWQGFLGNRPLTDLLLSRLRERCHTVKIDGPCLRAQQGGVALN
jgi:DNA replication protein DnaC